MIAYRDVNVPDTWDVDTGEACGWFVIFGAQAWEDPYWAEWDKAGATQLPSKYLIVEGENGDSAEEIQLKQQLAISFTEWVVYRDKVAYYALYGLPTGPDWVPGEDEGVLVPDTPSGRGTDNLEDDNTPDSDTPPLQDEVPDPNEVIIPGTDDPITSAIDTANTMVDRASQYGDVAKLKSLMTKATMASKLFDYQPNCFDKSAFGTLVGAMAKMGTGIQAQLDKVTDGVEGALDDILDTINGISDKVFEVLDQIEGQINAAVEAVKAAFLTPLIQGMKKYIPKITMDGSVITDVLDKYDRCLEVAQAAMDAGLHLLADGQALIESGMDKLIHLPFDALSNVVPCMKTPDQMIAVLGIKNKVKAKASEIFLKSEAGILMNKGLDGIPSLQSSLDLLSKESFFGDVFAEQYSSVVYPKIVGMIPNEDDVPWLTDVLGKLGVEDRINWNMIKGDLTDKTMLKSKTAFTDLVLSTKLPAHASLESMVPGQKSSTFGFIKRIKEFNLMDEVDAVNAGISLDGIIADIFASDPDAPAEASQEILDIAEGTYSKLLDIDLEQEDFDILFGDDQEPVLCLASIETKRYMWEGDTMELANSKGLLDSYSLELEEQLVQEGLVKGTLVVAESRVVTAEEALAKAKEALRVAILYNDSLEAEEIEEPTGGR